MYSPLGYSGMSLASLFFFYHSEFYSGYVNMIPVNLKRFWFWFLVFEYESGLPGYDSGNLEYASGMLKPIILVQPLDSRSLLLSLWVGPLGWFRLCWPWFQVFEYEWCRSAYGLDCFDYGPLGYSGMFLASVFLCSHSKFYCSYVNVISHLKKFCLWFPGF